jgi:hypothetical protein
MAANATNTLQATIISADANGAISINRGFGNPALAGNVGDLTINQQLANGANVMSLPITGGVTGLQNVYIKNNAGPGGGTITVAVNINGAGLVTIALLQPGGICVPIWNIVAVAASQITAITLTASVANIPVEYFFGG